MEANNNTATTIVATTAIGIYPRHPAKDSKYIILFTSYHSLIISFTKEKTRAERR